MINYQKTIIFIEPPGNIQKDLHALRLSCAKVTRTTSIISFPELIPLMSFENETIELSSIETLIRGKIHICLTPESHSGWLFLPATIAHDKLPYQQELSIPSWRCGYITLGPTILYDRIIDVLSRHNTLSFSAGRILLTDVTFLNEEGTSYVIAIRDSLFRKKQ